MSGITKKNIDQAIKFVYSDNNSLSVIFHDNDLLMGIAGEFNKNLQELEKITKCSLYSRGNSILIKSEKMDNQYACLKIYDQGPGISVEYKDKIFDRFYSDRKEFKNWDDLL